LDFINENRFDTIYNVNYGGINSSTKVKKPKEFTSGDSLIVTGYVGILQELMEFKLDDKKTGRSLSTCRAFVKSRRVDKIYTLQKPYFK
jgi:hypothetical protein